MFTIKFQSLAKRYLRILNYFTEISLCLSLLVVCCMGWSQNRISRLLVQKSVLLTFAFANLLINFLFLVGQFILEFPVFMLNLKRMFGQKYQLIFPQKIVPGSN